MQRKYLARIENLIKGQTPTIFTFPGKKSVPIKPFCRIANRVLVKLEAEADKRSLSCVVRLGEILIIKTSQIVAQAYPGILHHIITDGDPFTVIDLARIPGVENAALQTDVPILGDVIASFYPQQDPYSRCSRSRLLFPAHTWRHNAATAACLCGDDSW